MWLVPYDFAVSALWHIFRLATTKKQDTLCYVTQEISKISNWTVHGRQTKAAASFTLTKDAVLCVYIDIHKAVNCGY